MNIIKYILVLISLGLAGCGGGDDDIGRKITEASIASGSGSHSVTRAFSVNLRSEKAARVQAVAPGPINSSDVYAFAEDKFSQEFPGSGVDGDIEGYIFRYYPATGNFIALKGGNLYLLGPIITGGQIYPLGPVEGLRCLIFPAQCAPVGEISVVSVSDLQPWLLEPVTVQLSAQSELQGLTAIWQIEGGSIEIPADVDVAKRQAILVPPLLFASDDDLTTRGYQATVQLGVPGGPKVSVHLSVQDMPAHASFGLPLGYLSQVGLMSELQQNGQSMNVINALLACRGCIDRSAADLSSFADWNKLHIETGRYLAKVIQAVDTVAKNPSATPSLGTSTVSGTVYTLDRQSLELMDRMFGVAIASLIRESQSHGLLTKSLAVRSASKNDVGFVSGFFGSVSDWTSEKVKSGADKLTGTWNNAKAKGIDIANTVSGTVQQTVKKTTILVRKGAKLVTKKAKAAIEIIPLAAHATGVTLGAAVVAMTDSNPGVSQEAWRIAKMSANLIPILGLEYLTNRAGIKGETIIDFDQGHETLKYLVDNGFNTPDLNQVFRNVKPEAQAPDAFKKLDVALKIPDGILPAAKISVVNAETSNGDIATVAGPASNGVRSSEVIIPKPGASEPVGIRLNDADSGKLLGRKPDVLHTGEFADVILEVICYVPGQYSGGWTGSTTGQISANFSADGRITGTGAQTGGGSGSGVGSYSPSTGSSTLVIGAASTGATFSGGLSSTATGWEASGRWVGANGNSSGTWLVRRNCI